MRTFAIVIALAITLAGIGRAAGPAPVIVMPDKIHWTAGTGAMKGSTYMVLYGDPSKASYFAIRVRMPNGLIFGPHMHGEQENVTILSGTLMVGLGDAVNRAKMMPLPAGGFASIPPGVHHYAMARGPVELEITGVGPRTMTAVH